MPRGHTLPAKIRIAVALAATYAIFVHALVAPALALPFVQSAICGHAGPHQPAAPGGNTPDCCSALCGALTHDVLAPPPLLRCEAVRTSHVIVWRHRDRMRFHVAIGRAGSARGPPFRP